MAQTEPRAAQSLDAGKLLTVAEKAQGDEALSPLATHGYPNRRRKSLDHDPNTDCRSQRFHQKPGVKSGCSPLLFGSTAVITFTSGRVNPTS
jgi:hypothetical protein